MDNNERIRVPRGLLGQLIDNTAKLFFQRLQNFCNGWDDIILPANMLQLGATAPDAVTLFGGTIKGLGFDGVATTEALHGSAEMLHGWIEGTPIRPHIHWMATTAAAGDVKWQLTYNWANNNELDLTETTLTVTAAASGTAWQRQVSSFGEIDGTGKKIGSQIYFRIFRNPTDAADTYGADAVLETVGIHYEKNSIGSQQEYTK